MRETISTTDVLRSARQRLCESRAWVQGRFSTDGDGDFVYPTSRQARCWCADGAILAAQEAMGAMPASMAGCTPGFWITQAAKILGFPTASMLNDAPQTKHADVLAMFDLAIKLAEASAGVPS